MTWRIANSLVKLRDQLNAAYPNRSKVSDGFIGDATHAATASDHNPNAMGVVCAFDITHTPSTGLDAHALADRLLAVRHPDLKYLISNYRIAGAWTNWQWSKYNGADPHDTHIHVSVGVGDDGKSKQPYDDENEWSVNDGGQLMNEEDAKEAYRAALHREPENDNVWRAWVGKSFAQFSKSVRSSAEWLTQNHYLLVAYPAAVKEIADLKKKVPAAVVPTATDRTPKLIQDISVVLNNYK